jgi:hypothetical protein
MSGEIEIKGGIVPHDHGEQLANLRVTIPASLLRDLWAGMIVAAINPDWTATPEAFAARGYELADALLKERARREGEK